MTDKAGKQPEEQESPADVKPPEELQPARDETREFTENPYAPEDKKTSDIVRLFYTTGVSIIPVISKRNILLGVLRKEDVISELADLERAGRYSIDQFITKLAKKMSLDELLQYGTIREFTVINLFGEVQGRWTRMQLFAASENPGQGASAENDMQAHKDEQVLEWIIYLILEHIPRALYAVNENGKTIFYNSHFEELYKDRLKSDVNTEFVEESLKNTEKNELFSGDGRKDLYFYNRDFDCNYEKIPLFSKSKRVGFLTYFDSNQSTKENLVISGVDIRGMSLEDILSSVERQLIVHAVKGVDDLKDAAESLKLTKHSLLGRMKKLGVEVKK